MTETATVESPQLNPFEQSLYSAANRVAEMVGRVYTDPDSVYLDTHMGFDYIAPNVNDPAFIYNSTRMEACADTKRLTIMAETKGARTPSTMLYYTDERTNDTYSEASGWGSPYVPVQISIQILGSSLWVRVHRVIRVQQDNKIIEKPALEESMSILLMSDAEKSDSVIGYNINMADTELFGLTPDDNDPDKDEKEILAGLGLLTDIKNILAIRTRKRNVRR